MKSFQEKEMYIYNQLTEDKPFEQFIEQIPSEFNGFVFYRIRKDTIGKSAALPTWGDFYEYNKQKLHYKGVVVYKQMDSDLPEAPYAEKMWSLIGKRLLPSCRVPDITLVKDKKYKEVGTISHIILDNEMEDMIDMNMLLFYKFQRQDLKQNKSIVRLKDLLDCVRIQVEDDANYKKVETSIIQTLLLDSFTNNGDRHVNNWSLVRDKQTNQYCVGLFDHSSSFVDMMNTKPYATVNGWPSTYIKVLDTPCRNGLGDLGNAVVSYLFSDYPDACYEFMDIFDREIEGFYQDISSAPFSIDKSRIRKSFDAKRRFIENLYGRDNKQGGGHDER